MGSEEIGDSLTLGFEDEALRGLFGEASILLGTKNFTSLSDLSLNDGVG